MQCVCIRYSMSPVYGIHLLFAMCSKYDIFLRNDTRFLHKFQEISGVLFRTPINFPMKFLWTPMIILLIQILYSCNQIAMRYTSLAMDGEYIYIVCDWLSFRCLVPGLKYDISPFNFSNVLPIILRRLQQRNFKMCSIYDRSIKVDKGLATKRQVYILHSNYANVPQICRPTLSGMDLYKRDISMYLYM